MRPNYMSVYLEGYRAGHRYSKARFDRLLFLINAWHLVLYDNPLTPHLLSFLHNKISYSPNIVQNLHSFLSTFSYNSGGHEDLRCLNFSITNAIDFCQIHGAKNPLRIADRFYSCLDSADLFHDLKFHESDTANFIISLHKRYAYMTDKQFRQTVETLYAECREMQRGLGRSQAILAHLTPPHYAIKKRFLEICEDKAA